MNILLTGATGFIGSNILNKIKISNKVYIILRNKKKNKIFNHKNIKIINFINYKTLNDKLSKIQIDIVIHTATHYSKKHENDDLQKFANSNILLGNIILDNLNKMKVKKFINFSTVWEDYNGVKENYFNLYSAYKKAFSYIIEFYKKNLKNIKFYNLMISDTFGENDKRPKLINVLKNNYKKNKTTTIVSKKLFINLLNVEDVVNAVLLIIKKNTKPGKYLIKNPKNFEFFKIFEKFNKKNKKKLKIEWINNLIIKEKTLSYSKLKSWKPAKSNIEDIINTIKY